VEPLDQPRRTRPKLGWQRREDLQASGSDDGSQPELRGRTGQPGQEQRLGLLAGHAGEPRAVALNEPDPAVRATLGIDRYACLGQGIDIAEHRAHRDLELLGERRGRHLAAGLEQEQQGDQAGSAHRSEGRKIT
jgi:hypothetical protein